MKIYTTFSILILSVFLLLSSCQNQKITSGEPKINSSECIIKGGEIVNTLGGDGCNSKEKFLGEVIGMKCPCVCCKK